MVEGRIQQLQSLIQNAAIIDEAGAHKSKLVMLGSTVKVKSSRRQVHEYTIVGPAEADPREGKISHESPVGRALMGKKLHDEVQVNAPKGIVTHQDHEGRLAAAAGYAPRARRERSSRSGTVSSPDSPCL